MKISLKDKDCFGLCRTVNGFVHLQTEYVEGKLELDKSRPMVGSIDYEGSEFQIHTGYDQLILSFGEDKHIFVTTTNNGDAVGTDGWRHAAYKIGLELAGEEVISDASKRSIREKHLDSVSDAILDHIHKLVNIDYVAINETEHSAARKEKVAMKM